MTDSGGGPVTLSGLVGHLRRPVPSPSAAWSVTFGGGPSPSATSANARTGNVPNPRPWAAPR
ncbi:hypothetical protein NKG05_11745 [Oerskovia sp. M15]